MSVHVGGLDVSTKRIGYAAPNGELFSITSRAGAEDPTRRLHELRRTLDLTIRRNPPIPTVMVIEGYLKGGGPKVGAMSRIRTGEIGGVARLWCFDHAVTIVDQVDPSTLKRFATGKGNADKMMMIAAAVALGFAPANDDEADAVHCRRMGRCAHGLEVAVLAHELDALDVVGGIWQGR